MRTRFLLTCVVFFTVVGLTTAAYVGWADAVPEGEEVFHPYEATFGRQGNGVPTPTPSQAPTQPPSATPTQPPSATPTPPPT